MQNYFTLFWEAIFWHSITEKYFMIWYSLENSIMQMFRIFQKVVRGGWENPTPPQWEVGIGSFTGGDFFTGWREPEEEWFWRFEPFSKLKTAFCENWTSIKIKIDMACVSKEYELKTKMEQEQWIQLEMLLLFGYNLKIVV